MNAPLGWAFRETVGFQLINVTEQETPRGRARLHYNGSKPIFTRWNDQGFPIEWKGHRFWKLSWPDGATCAPEES